MPKVQSISARITTLLLLLAVGFAAEPRRISVYTPQANFQVDILVRDGVDYVGLTDLLEPLGRLESRIGGGKLTLLFNGGAAEFQDGKRQYRSSTNTKLELPSNFLLVDGRGYIPVASITQLLLHVADLSSEFHAGPRRLFVGATQLRYSAELRRTPTRLVLTFPSPVHPTSVIEKGRVRLIFRREPVVSNGTDSVVYGDPFLLSTSFAEVPEGAEFVATVSQPATVAIGDGGHTVTISAVAPPAPPATPAAGTPPLASSANQPHPAASSATNSSQAPRSRPLVILDAAHGGSDTGSVLSPTLLEKTVTLALARRLQKELEARGISVVLTRVADTLLTWDQRAVSANTSHASLYIALHAAGSGHGVRVYTSMIAPMQPGQTNRSFLPWEQAQAPYLGGSSRAASVLAAECALGGLPVRSSAAPLRPLNSVTLAAVAVEVAPLGDSADEIGSPEYQQRIATVLASAIGKLEAAQ